MKKNLLTTLMLLFVALFMNAQTSGTLTVTTTTSAAGGNYAPRNVVAVWIEDEAGNFVKTLLAYANNRKTHLNNWQASTAAAGSEYNTVDAITGATKSNHGTRTCSWDGTSFEGTDMADGTYYVWMELTDKNSTGNFSSFSFTKDGEPENITPLNKPSFSAIEIDWLPSTIGIDDQILASDFKVFPNPTPGVFKVLGEKIIEVEILTAKAQLIYKGNPDVDISTHPNGVYFVLVKTENGSLTKKIIKQ